MPRLNTAGSAVCGIAGNETSIDGTTPAALVGSTGGWEWLTDDVIVGNSDFGMGFLLYRYTVSTLTLAVEDATGGASELSAGGDVWVKWLLPAGVTSSAPPSLVLPVAGVGATTEDGVSVIVVTRSTAFGLQVYEADGTPGVTVNALITLPVVRARGDVLSYKDASGWHLRTISTGAVLPYVGQSVDVNFMCPAINGTQLWVLERDTNDLLLLRGATSGQGYPIHQDAMMFNPDVQFIASNIARIAYATNAGETASSLVLHDVNVSTGAHSMATIVAGAPVFVDQPTLPIQTVGTSGGSSQARSLITGLYSQPLLRKGGPEPLIDERWYKALMKLSDAATAPIDLGSDQVTGVLDQTNGGTSNDQGSLATSAPQDAEYLVAVASGGLTAERVVTDTATVTWDFSTVGQAKANVVGGSWIPLVDGSEPPVFITDGAGVLILVGYP